MYTVGDVRGRFRDFFYFEVLEYGEVVEPNSQVRISKVFAIYTKVYVAKFSK